MKNMLLQAKKMSRVIVLSMAFFFVGLASINAQYLGSEEASIVLKNELQTLESDIPNASTNAAREDLAFKMRYFTAVLVEINTGSEVGAAIHDNAPADKPRIHSSGLVEFTADVPGFKQDVEAVVNYLDDLLSE